MSKIMVDIRNLVWQDGGMADNDLTGLDAWLTKEPIVTTSSITTSDGATTTSTIVSRTNECIHCGDEGCKHCEGDDDGYDEERELDLMETSYERYLDRS